MRIRKVPAAICAVLLALAAAAAAACAPQGADGGKDENATTVTYMVDGRVWLELEVPDASVQAPENPVKEGYDFIGWYEDESFVTPFVLADYAASEDRTDITVYARFELSLGAGRYEDEYISVSPATEGKKHDDSFYWEYATGVQTYLYVELTSADLGGADKVGLPLNFDLGGDDELDFAVKKDYTFDWYEGDWSTPNGAQMFSLGYGSNIQLLAVSDSSSVVHRYLVDLYVLHDYSVELYANIYETKPFAELTVIEQQRLPADVRIYETSFDFKGYLRYDVQDDRYVTFDRSQPVMSDLKLYQQYEDVTVTADADGGVLEEEIVIEPYRKERKLPVPVKEGYDFVGWRTEEGIFASSAGSTRENMLSDETDARSLTAVYEAKKYYQSFSGGKTTVRPLDVSIEYTDEDTIGEVRSMTYTLNGSPVELDEENSFAYGGAVTLAGAPASGDFRFTDEEGKVVEGGEIAAWSYAEGQVFSLEFLLSFDSMDAGTVEGVWCAQGEEPQLPVPEKEGFVFGGWFTKNSPYAAGAEQIEEMPARSLTLYASWTSEGAVGEVDYSLNTDKKTLSVSGYKEGEEVVVPEVAGNLTVTRVSNFTPDSGSVAAKLRRITLPETVTSVSGNAFSRLTALEEVFFLCKESVNLGQSVLPHVNDTVLYFAGTCSAGGGSTIYLDGEDSKYIDNNYTWANNIGVSSAYLKTVTNYPENPSALYTKADGIWYRLTGSSAAVCSFQGGLSGSVTVPASVEYEGKQYAVTALDEFAFCELDEITSLTLPEGLKTMGRYAVLKLHGLQQLSLPASLEKLEELSVFSLLSLQSVSYAGTKEQWSEVEKPASRPGDTWINGVQTTISFTCEGGTLTEAEWRGNVPEA